MDRFSIDNLVLDAAPLLSTAASSSASALRGLASNFITTPDVLSEIRDKTSRELFASTLTVLGLEDDKSETGGLQVKEPTLEAVGKGGQSVRRVKALGCDTSSIRVAVR